MQFDFESDERIELFSLLNIRGAGNTPGGGRKEGGKWDSQWWREPEVVREKL